MCDTIFHSLLTTHINIIVMLQPFDVANADKSKHKFMVQSMFPPPGEVKLEEIVRICCIVEPVVAVTIHWTGLLDWNTGLDYWTEIFSFFGQVFMFLNNIDYSK